MLPVEPVFDKSNKEILSSFIDQLLDGKIQGIEFGDPSQPGGYMSHHRILLIKNTLVYKPVVRGALGSGVYFSRFEADALIDFSSKYLEEYLAPNPRIDALRKRAGLRTSFSYEKIELKYFSV